MDVTELWDAAPGWLNTASYGLPPRPAFEELQAVLTDWRHGATDWKPWDASVGRARAAFARLVSAPVADVSVSSTVSQIMSVVATALPPGARVVVPEIEFTSNLFPWAVAARVEPVPADRLAEAVTRGTAAVAFSLVQSATGYVTPLADVVAAAREHDALVVVDASQACGWLPVEVAGVDVLACAAYKWLMAPRGAAFAYLSPRVRERMRPLAANWYGGADEGGSYYGPPLRLAGDARAFDLSPAWFSFVGAAPAIELLNELGVERVRDHDVALANRFLTGLGLPPSDSAIVSVDAPGERLAAAGIRAAVRAGKVRASFHLYTTRDDVDRALDALT
ncbi:aminotransferase class V-fold PLP-dependent enzyme [Nonomuraea gerenzanensis]|uniref:Cysteine desulfurase n=1 Tax=Nonomuraea gerenzanensis TaxID=93944 RepID=A0A1M4EAZ5_9ACTN|nr:aminotransferase class V-fold PLP-dependent enzyme [Nonomuraea gerenzanensis]UBU18137.1 aminotransferase class V-fold PLP-dependent enzyme [Nonomuraea gerenzanensis]SBO95946.1 Cysteine desulfurase [Nonomuraea gerenzanensis]